MGSTAGRGVDAHLCAGGTVVTASERAARAILRDFHSARRSEGLEAWPGPRVLDWHSFVRQTWEERTGAGLLPLNSVQEQALWESIVSESGHEAAILSGPRRNLAALAMEAHALLGAYAPRYFENGERRSWQQESAVFSRWLSTFDEACREHECISAHRLAVEAVAVLRSHSNTGERLLLAGFDRILPVQQEFLKAWGDWRSVESGESAGTIRFHSAPDASSELHACAAWCRLKLASDPDQRILVLSQDVAKTRGEIERAFLRQSDADSAFGFEFSLGVPLSQTALTRSALMMLQWLHADLAENELDWLFSTTYMVAEPGESLALQAWMRSLRDRGLQRVQWTLEAFLSQPGSTSLISRWKERVLTAQRLLRAAPREQSPVEWASLVSRLLTACGWPGGRALTSAEHQSKRRWDSVLDTCASLGFDGRRLPWHEFFSELSRIAGETLFAPESEDAPVLIAGPAEAAGLQADAVWFLGAHEDAWPARGEMHPLLPPEVQRQFGMPHATAQFDWDLARTVTERIVASAPEVHFSYARQADGVDTRPSRLAVHFAGTPSALEAELVPPPVAEPLATCTEDGSRIPFPMVAGEIPHLRGGAGLLTKESQCPFQAFATGRLNASICDPAQSGFTPAERGNFLHAALKSIWSGPPDGIGSHGQLMAIADLAAFVARHVHKTLPIQVPSRVREQMPGRYIDLEEERVTRLLTSWLEFEKTRVPFDVLLTETSNDRTIAGLVSLRLRLDRLDKLTDGTVLVVDYKTGDVKPNAWDLPRPDDVQLPLYASFGLDEGQEIGGLVFAKVRAGNMCFAGRVGDARSTIDPSLGPTCALVRYPLGAEQILDWREKIEELARDYLAGKPDVDPRDPAKTCERCGLQTICRIQEREPVLMEAESEDNND